MSKNPADLFLELYLVAEKFEDERLAVYQKMNPVLAQKILKSLRNDDGECAYQEIRDLLPSDFNNLSESQEYLLLNVLEEIDCFFAEVHPRALALDPRLGRLRRLPEWLDFLVDGRKLQGHFASLGDRALIPRGPLSRLCREQDATNGAYLPDRFASLACVMNVLSHNKKPINVRVKVIEPGGAHGVMVDFVDLVSRVGAERIAFIPVAEHPNEVNIRSRVVGSTTFVKYSLDVDVRAVDRIRGALDRAGDVDILIAPELTIDQEQSSALQAMLLSGAMGPQVIVAGSGLFKCEETGKDLNRAIVYNGSGGRLWAQSKIWSAGIRPECAAHFGVKDAEHLVTEDYFGGRELTVADIDGVGRCIILICQDLTSPDFAVDVIREYQPDWVFVPILDFGSEQMGRWAHQYANDLSKHSQARFVVCNSIAWAKKYRPDVNVEAFGLAVGPKAPASRDELGRMLIQVRLEDDKSPGYGVIVWSVEADEWEQTFVGSKVPKSK